MGASPIELRRSASSHAAHRREARQYQLRYAVQFGLIYLVLTLACIVAVFPFLYILSLSFKQSTALVTYPPQWIPNPLFYGNYTSLLLEKPFLRWGFNTVLVAGVITLIKLLFDSMSGYAFAKMEFPLKEVIFVFILSTMMIPFAATLIPTYLIVRNLGMQNTYWGLILPGLASPIGIFMMRQFIESLPNDLENAARIDGCSEFYIYWHIILPLAKPALAVLGIFTFMIHWQAFVWPLVITTSDEMRVLTVGLASLKGQWVTDWGIVAAGSVLIMLPMTLVFLFFQRYFIQASIAGALKE
jgi:ABC-type glycerol-3-phosphate transport system permease component